MLKRLTKWDWLAIAIILIGAIFRLYHLFIVPMDQPFRLGGLFYEFSRQIAQHNFALPAQIPYYSVDGIPFAYPPLSFYVQAIFIHWWDPALFWTVNLLPPLITLLSLPAFYWMVRQFTTDTPLALASLCAFAFIPQAFINQIEAAGLAEAFGMLALILFLGMIFRWRQKPTALNTILAGLLLGDCVLSSPGSAYAAALFSALLFVWVSVKSLKNRSLKPVGQLLLVGVVGILISAPYWASVMQNHGADFFITPFLGQHQMAEEASQQFKSILSFQPAGLFLGFIWNWIILAGVFWAALHRQYLALVLFGLFWLIPREGVWLVSIPGAILAGMGLVYILIPLLKKTFQKGESPRPPLAPGILATLLLLGVIANTIFTVQAFITDQEWYLDRDQIAALSTLQEQIPEESGVITVGNIALAEWAPALLQREVLNIEYGLEWQPAELAQVREINLALEEGDWGLVIAAIQAYTPQTQIYLIATPEGGTAIGDSLPPEASLSLLQSHAALSLYLLELQGAP